MTALVATIPVPRLSDKEEALQQEQHEKAPTDQTLAPSVLLSTDCANPKTRPRSLPIHSFNHISKETDNVEELVRFYTKVMGFRRIKRPPFPFAGAWLFMPPATALHIIEKDPSVDLPEGPCAAVKKMGNWQEVAKNPSCLKRIGHHMAFRTEDVALTKKLLTEYGIKFAEHVVPQTNQRQLFFFDPDGNGIEICDCDVDPPPFEEEEEDDQDDNNSAVEHASHEASDVQDK